MGQNKYQSTCINIVEKYKCNKCGLCCKNNNLFLTQYELNVICDKLKIKEENVKIKNKSDDYLILNAPCPFLKNNVCIIYDFRPDICRVFPFSCRIESLQSLKTCNLSKEIYKDIKLFIGDLPEIDNIPVNNIPIEDYEQYKKTIKTYIDEDKTLEKEINMILSFSLIQDFLNSKQKGNIKMPIPQIVISDAGYHNKDLDFTQDRLLRAKTYQDLSTIIICPTRGQIHAKVVQSWLGLIKPMNQKVIGPIFAIGMEVGEAYNSLVQMILDNPDLSKWKYILTVEEDNIPPSDGLLKLYENMDKYDVVGGLYWTKGEGGMAMMYGDPKVMPKNFIPQIPIPETVLECNGLGMGFNLFKTSMFNKIPKPWFKTMQERNQCYTQDLYFYERAAMAGFRFACDTRVKVGHYDSVQDIIW
jgi:Fe-S-cluster containining protein